VDAQILVVHNSIQPLIDAAMATLGDIVNQDVDAINITGGAIDGVVIGGLVPALGSFTQVTTDVIVGSHGLIRLDGTGGYANSAAIISADDTNRPNVSIVPNANGAFVVMAGGTPIFRSHVNGRTVVGAGGDDGLNILQVHGDAIIKGRATLGGGTMTGTTTPTFGNTAPAMVNANDPHWVRIRIQTTSGIRECVMPAWEVM
jgi:hypothetical protein